MVIQGTCNENVLISRDDVTLMAGPAGATVSGPDTTKATITVQAQRVLIDGIVTNGFRVTGGRNGCGKEQDNEHAWLT